MSRPKVPLVPSRGGDDGGCVNHGRVSSRLLPEGQGEFVLDFAVIWTVSMGLLDEAKKAFGVSVDSAGGGGDVGVANEAQQADRGVADRGHDLGGCAGSGL